VQGQFLHALHENARSRRSVRQEEGDSGREFTIVTSGSDQVRPAHSNSTNGGATDDAEPNGLAALLAALRARRGLSAEAVAKQAGIAPTTLRRWESGAHRPRVAELHLVLSILRARNEERLQALTLLDARRGTAALRRGKAAAPQPEEAAPVQWASRVRLSQTGWQDAPGAPRAEPAADPWWAIPGSGDLLRAMRERQGLTNKGLAAALGVPPYQISRWEKSDALPPADLLEHLCEALGAYPEEQTFLESHSRLLPPLESQARGNRHGLDVYVALLDEMDRKSAACEPMPGDLAFLAIEAQLTPLARAGRRDAIWLLGRCYLMHAEWMERNSRIERLAALTEATLRAMRLLDRTSGNIPWSERWWSRAAAMRADCFLRIPLTHLPPGRAVALRYGWAVDFLKEQVPAFTQPHHAAELLRIIGGYVHLVGGETAKEGIATASRALRLAQQAAAQEQDAAGGAGVTDSAGLPVSVGAFRVLLGCSLTLAPLLRMYGRIEEALTVVSEQETLLPLSESARYDAAQTAWLAYRKAELLADVGEREEARATLPLLFALSDRCGFPFLRDGGECVLQRLAQSD
jgi:transcriptional regulator with XRE-family HTH domain